MGRQIIIGKEGNQPFAIGDPKVSRRHAVLNVDDQGNLMLIDNNSTNGTYIYNGTCFERLYPQQTYRVTGDSMIQLGPDTRFHVRRLLNPSVNGAAPQKPAGQQQTQGNKPAQPKPPKRVNIKGLRLVSDHYNAKKMQLESKAGMVNNLRSCTILITMVAGVVGTCISNMSDMDKSKAMTATILSLVLAIVLMVVLLMVINNFNKKIILERAANDKAYAVKYCCPECGASFRGKIYENILSERKCPRCKVEFYDSDLKN